MPELLENSLLDSVGLDKLKELLGDAGEIALDQILQDGLLKDIPIFGSLIKLSGIVMGIRERIFAKTVYKFLLQLKDISQEDRQAFTAKFSDNKNAKQKMGETLLILLDKIDDIDKATILGNLFKAYIENQYNYIVFLRLSSIVNKVFLPDVYAYTKFTFNRDYNQKVNTIQLANAGFFNTRIKTKDITQRSSTSKDKYLKSASLINEANKYGLLIIKFGLLVESTYLTSLLGTMPAI